MFEKVNPHHPDKVADRIAGAIVDLAYTQSDSPKVAVEVLIGHGHCTIIAETDRRFSKRDINRIVHRIAGNVLIHFHQVAQDRHLADNQQTRLRCGDNGIFKGCPTTQEQCHLSFLARQIDLLHSTDGKYLISDDKVTVCQSHCPSEVIYSLFKEVTCCNPLGDWTGGTDVDSGATNRKLGSDMGDAVTGGGLHGKDLSKADVSVNIYLHLLARDYKCEVRGFCNIGSSVVHIETDEKKWDEDFRHIVEEAHKFVKTLGGFEKLAEWGLI